MYAHEHPGHLEEARHEEEEHLRRQLERTRRRAESDSDDESPHGEPKGSGPTEDPR
jgi:hypothetical protein